jgi:hypothetical protein
MQRMRYGLQLPPWRSQSAVPAPPDLRDWLPTDHLAWFVRDVVDQLDLTPFLRAYRSRHGRQGKPRKDSKPSASRSDGLHAVMTARLASADGKALYALRRQTIEPVFGQHKDIRGARRFLAAARAGRLRGRVEAAVRHPQPAQAVAPYPQPTSTDAACHLSGGDRRPRPPSRPAPMAARAVPATPKPHHSTAEVAGPGPFGNTLYLVYLGRGRVTGASAYDVGGSRALG